MATEVTIPTFRSQYVQLAASTHAHTHRDSSIANTVEVIPNYTKSYHLNSFLEYVPG